MNKDLKIIISANANTLLNALLKSKAGLYDFERSITSTSAATNRLNDTFDGFKSAAKLAMVTTGTAAVAGLGMAVKSAGDFESSLSQLKQASGATSQEMQLLNAKARELGKDNSLAGVTASKAAQAMVELSKAGLSVKDTMDAAKGVMSLAKAGNLEYAQAAVIAASALNAFNMKGNEATKVADALAAGANASQADLADLALGLQQSATVAKQFKLSLNENITALSIFANNGIRGSDAGTSLKTMLIALANPSTAAYNKMKDIGFSAYDASGKFVGLAEMSNRLQKSLSNLTDKQKQQALATIFGTDAFRAAAILSQNAGESWNKMASEVGKAGAAQEAAAAQQGGYQKAMENFSNTLSDVGLTVGEKLLPPLTDFINAASDKVGPAFDFITKNGDKFIITLTTLAGTFGTIRLAGFISDLKKADNVLGLLIGEKNSNGIYALSRAFKAGGNSIKTIGKWAISSTADMGHFTVAATKAKASAAWSSIKSGASAIKLVGTAAIGAAKDIGALGLAYAKTGAQAAAMTIKTSAQTAATTLMTAAQTALNFVMGLNPITLVIIGITALIAAFALLWVNCEGFRNFFIGMWNGIVSFLGGVWNGIVAIFSVVGQWFTDVFTDAWSGIVSAWSAVTGWFGGVWNGIVGIFNGVAGWFSGIFQGAWNAITGIFGRLGGFFGGVWSNIVGMFGRLGGFVGDAIGGAVKGAVNGALSMVENMANGFIGTINGVIRLINKIPGVNIGNIPRLQIPRLATGGIVGPQNGGSIIYAGDGGQNEWVVPESKMASLVDQINRRRGDGGGMTKHITINNTYNVRDKVDAQMVASDLGYLLSQA